MRWRRKRKDPISEEAKRAAEQAEQQSQEADVVGAEADQQLHYARVVTDRLIDIRRRNHFAEAFGIVLGGNQ
ncbi:DUF7620 family protein [Arthrobacter pityocampae]|uniref:DUF7620 family protein n=1 Tax=Arthrobacter pityocampae TaxID=547334 RepID=UPI003735C3F4